MNTYVQIVDTLEDVQILKLTEKLTTKDSNKKGALKAPLRNHAI